MQYILYRKVLVLDEDAEMLITAIQKKEAPSELKYIFRLNGQEEVVYQVMNVADTIKNNNYEDKVNLMLMCNKRLQSWCKTYIE